MREIKEYWERSPIFDYEVKEERFSKAYYDRVDEISLKDNNPFNLHLFDFDAYKDKRTLDIGCGTGFLCRQYARSGAIVYGVDLTEISVIRTQKSLELFNLKGNVVQADASVLPFNDNVFDLVTSIGVLHHIPSTEQGIAEVYRVLKPGGKTVISLYYENILLRNRLLFNTMKLGLRILLKAPKERNGLQFAKTPEDFVRSYDGVDNPVGRMFSHVGTKRLFEKFEIIAIEQHGVPTRFLIGSKYWPVVLRRFVDSHFGICLCIVARKPL